jgi:hypothetical protein
VVSRRITVPHILSVNSVLQRRVTIWDNLNANDYDQRRLCLGPFSGRSSNVSSRISGMLTNPNCEFELNFIPLNTLGQWFEILKINEKRDKIDDNDDDDSIQTTDVYQIDKAFHQSLVDWLPEFNKIKSANDSQQIIKVIFLIYLFNKNILFKIKIDNSPQAMSPKSQVSLLTNDEDSQDSINENQISSKIHKMECDINGELTLDDVRLLVEFFYLPYQHGPNAQQIYMDFYWLRFNYNSHQNVKNIFYSLN